MRPTSRPWASHKTNSSRPDRVVEGSAFLVCFSARRAAHSGRCRAPAMRSTTARIRTNSHELKTPARTGSGRKLMVATEKLARWIRLQRSDSHILQVELAVAPEVNDPRTHGQEHRQPQSEPREPR